LFLLCFVQEEFEDTKGVIRILKSKNRQHDRQKKKTNKQTNKKQKQKLKQQKQTNKLSLIPTFLHMGL
jgi:hypothetical protein